MRKKWYFFTFVFSLIGLGLIQQYHNPTANQEIIVQFLDANDSKKSVEQISEALQIIDAESISVNIDGNGFYRIAYHSSKTTHIVKQLLAEQIAVSFEDSSSNNDKSLPKGYNFDVFKIEKGQTSKWNFDAQVVYTLNFKSDRSFNPDVFKFPVLIETSKTYFDLRVAYNANQLIVFVSDNTSYNIPEVRAGPLA